ncbi:MAG: TonB family protein [Halieaceae bacterium]|nr:TonB family protein [Halieaceae bacterium]
MSRKRNLFRTVVGAALAIPIAGGLFFIMQYLIASVDPKIDEEKSTRLPPIHMPKVEITTPPKETKPPKVNDPVKPPPELSTPKLKMGTNQGTINLPPPDADDVTIGDRTSAYTSHGDYLPIIKVKPVYPRSAQTRGIEGHCIIEYVVTRSGAIRDPQVVDCQPSGVFEKASLKASLKFKYKPRFVDGEAIEVTGVQNKFTYELEN